MYFSGEEAKKKWKNLKDKFRKTIQKPPPRSGSGAVTQKDKWRFFDLMLFVKDTMIPSKMIGSLSTPINTPLSDEEIDGMFDSVISCEDDEDVERTLSPCVPPPTDASSSKGRTNTTPKSNFATARPHRAKSTISSKIQLEKEMVLLEKQKVNAILDIQKNSKKKEEKSDDYYFLMSLLPYMTSLDPLLKLELRGKIQIEVMNSYKINKQQSEPQLRAFNRPQAQDHRHQIINYNSQCQSSNNMASSTLPEDLQSGSSSSSCHYQNRPNSNGSYDNNYRGASLLLDLDGQDRQETTMMRGFRSYTSSDSLVSPSSLDHPPSGHFQKNQF